MKGEKNMITQRHLTIKDAKNEVVHLENELEVYLTRKKINFLKTQPGTVNYKDIVTSKTNNIFDKYTHYVIKDEEIDTKIYGIQESIASYLQFIVNEMKRMSKYDEIGLICYLREEEHQSWKFIDKILHRSDGYSKVKYMRYKRKKVN